MKKCNLTADLQLILIFFFFDLNLDFFFVLHIVFFFAFDIVFFFALDIVFFFAFDIVFFFAFDIVFFFAFDIVFFVDSDGGRFFGSRQVSTSRRRGGVVSLAVDKSVRAGLGGGHSFGWRDDSRVFKGLLLRRLHSNF